MRRTESSTIPSCIPDTKQPTLRIAGCTYEQCQGCAAYHSSALSNSRQIGLRIVSIFTRLEKIMVRHNTSQMNELPRTGLHVRMSFRRGSPSAACPNRSNVFPHSLDQQLNPLVYIHDSPQTIDNYSVAPIDRTIAPRDPQDIYMRQSPIPPPIDVNRH